MGSFGRGKSRINSIKSMVSQILWVQDGVVIEREALALESDIGIGVLVDATGLGTDLGGFALRQSEEKKSARKKALEGVGDELQSRLEAGEANLKVTCSYSVDKWMALGAVGAGLLDPALAACGLLAVGFGHGIGRLVLNNSSKKLRDELRQNLPRIAKRLSSEDRSDW